MPVSSINPAIPVANSTLASGPIRSQFQAAANDVNSIYGLISAYPNTVQLPANVYVGSNGQMSRSAFGIPISMTQVWSVLAHDGVSEFYSSPIYYPNFVSAGYSGPAIIFQGYDWYIYVVNALTGALLTGFPVATAGPCYGRCQAANIDTSSYAGMTMIFGATHGGINGTGGQIIALHSDGTSAWTKNNVYADEGGNDMNASVSLGTPTTLSGNINSSVTTIPVTSGANIANGQQIQIGVEVMLVTGGGGSNSLTATRGYNGTTAASHSSTAPVNTGFPTVGGILTTGLAVSSGGNFSVTVAGTNPNWATNAWQRYEGVNFNALVMIVSGTGAGQQNPISGVGSGNVIFVNNQWSTNPDATSIIQILPRYQSDIVFQHAGTLNLESGTTYLYTTGDDNTIVKRAAVSGAKAWRYWTGENNEPYPLIAPVTDGITPSVLFNSVDSYTYCLSISGTLNWRTQGTANVGLDSFLSAANVSNSGTYLNVVVNQRRSGNSAAGRTCVLRGDTGAKVSESGDQLGDNASGPLLIPRTDGSGKYNIFSAGNACLATLYDDQMNGQWRRRYADNSEIDQFRSTPFLADMNYDGVNEIVCGMQNTGTLMVWSQSGVELAQLTLPCRLNASDCGIEGTPTQFLNNGLLYLVIPAKDGYMRCYQINQNAG